MGSKWPDPQAASMGPGTHWGVRGASLSGLEPCPRSTVVGAEPQRAVGNPTRGSRKEGGVGLRKGIRERGGKRKQKESRLISSGYF